MRSPLTCRNRIDLLLHVPLAGPFTICRFAFAFFPSFGSLCFLFRSRYSVVVRIWSTILACMILRQVIELFVSAMCSM
ncbi:hypothetical protein V8C42DRAFT_321027 [Trichoderma barbatum]